MSFRRQAQVMVLKLPLPHIGEERRELDPDEVGKEVAGGCRRGGVGEIVLLVERNRRGVEHVMATR